MAIIFYLMMLLLLTFDIKLLYSYNRLNMIDFSMFYVPFLLFWMVSQTFLLLHISLLD